MALEFPAELGDAFISDSIGRLECAKIFVPNQGFGTLQTNSLQELNRSFGSYLLESTVKGGYGSANGDDSGGN